MCCWLLMTLTVHCMLWQVIAGYQSETGGLPVGARVILTVLVAVPTTCFVIFMA
jgi:hypothetical protein